MPSVNVMTAPGPFALALMKALGLPAGTTSFELRCAAGEAVTVKCQYHPDANTAAGFDPQRLLAEYQLIERRARPAIPQPQPFSRSGGLGATNQGWLLTAAIVFAVPALVLLCAWLGGR